MIKMTEPRNKEDLEIADNNPKRMKFVDYYNEWWEHKFWRLEWEEKFKYTMRFDDVHIISDKMWFIFWLEYNGKVDTDYLTDLSWFEWYSTYERLIMLLSIQENPITYILDILK